MIVGGTDSSIDTTLDVFRPDVADEPLPAVFWVHGGAWISGHKSDVDPHLRILASEGYVTIGANYTVGPDAVYPTAVRQLNEALAYLDANADELGIDPQRASSSRATPPVGSRRASSRP